MRCILKYTKYLQFYTVPFTFCQGLHNALTKHNTLPCPDGFMSPFHLLLSTARLFHADRPAVGTRPSVSAPSAGCTRTAQSRRNRCPSASVTGLGGSAGTTKCAGQALRRQPVSQDQKEVQGQQSVQIMVMTCFQVTSDRCFNCDNHGFLVYVPYTGTCDIHTSEAQLEQYLAISVNIWFIYFYV